MNITHSIAVDPQILLVIKLFVLIYGLNTVLRFFKLFKPSKS